MSKSVQDYLNLITSEHQDKPKFMAMVAATVAPFVQVQALLDSMIRIFDIDLPPVGNQLDIIGQWVGVSRDIKIPISGVYFSWNSTSDKGWDLGSWQDPTAPTSISVLPDDAYLVLIKAKIASNNWGGTTEELYDIWSILFPTLHILIQDNQDMSYAIAFQGSIIDSLTLALITGGYLDLKPEGIRISEYFIPGDTEPLFGWDIENSYIQGWNQGSWPMEILPT